MAEEILEQTPVTTPDEKVGETQNAEIPAGSAPATERPSEPETAASEPESVRKRIDKLTAQKYELARQNQEIQRQNEEFQRKIREFESRAGDGSSLPPPGESVPAHTPSPAPSGGLFTDLPPEQRAVVQKTLSDLDANFNRQLPDARKKYQDFDNVIAQAANIADPGVRILVQSKDNAADIAYYLGQNPSELYDLNIALMQGNVVKAAEEIAVLGYRLKQTAPPKTTKAPPPAPTLGGRTGSETPGYEGMSMADYARARKGK